METPNSDLAKELARISNLWLDRASPWVPLWSEFCLWRARVHTKQLSALALKAVRKVLGEDEHEN